MTRRIRCVVCGHRMYIDHFEQHWDPPHEIDICLDCHKALDGHKGGLVKFNSNHLLVPERVRDKIRKNQIFKITVDKEGRIIYDPVK